MGKPPGIPFLRRENEDNTVSLRKEEGIPVKVDQLLGLIKVQVEGQLEDY